MGNTYLPAGYAERLNVDKLDSNIYGSDDNGMASRIAADALGSPSSASGIDQSALSRGVDDKGPNPDVKVISDKGGKADSKGNH